MYLQSFDFGEKSRPLLISMGVVVIFHGLVLFYGPKHLIKMAALNLGSSTKVVKISFETSKKKKVEKTIKKIVKKAPKVLPVKKEVEKSIAKKVVPKDGIVNPLSDKPLVGPRPKYPRRAKRRGIEGEVLVKVFLDKFGAPTRAVLAKSSGFDILDESALKAILKWRFRPAKLNGLAVASYVVQPFVFKLND